jgi:hypothetical protein
MAQIADLIGGATIRDGPPVPVRHVVEPSRKDARFLVDRSCGNIFSMNHIYMKSNGGVGIEWLFVVLSSLPCRNTLISFIIDKVHMDYYASPPQNDRNGPKD